MVNGEIMSEISDLKTWLHYIPLVLVILLFHFYIGMTAILPLQATMGFTTMLVVYAISLYFVIAITDIAVHAIFRVK